MEIEEQLLDVDGSCRDVNFPDVDHSQAIELVKYIQSFSVLDNAIDPEGHQLSVEEVEKSLSFSSSETIVSYWRCEGLVSQVQLFFSWSNPSGVYVELTFFPNDIVHDLFSLREFLDWLKPILIALETNEYYVRYENVSWEYGDVSRTSGVIFTNSQYAVNG